jgi:hypothetical protein
VNEQDIALWERRLGDGLNALADDEAPSLSVTVADVIAGARGVRRRRSRTVFALCAVLVAATALTFGAVAAVGRGGSATPIPAAPADTDPGITAAPTASLGSGTDPATGITFGWLPTTTIGAYDVSRQLTGPDNGYPLIAGSKVDAPNGVGYSTVVAWSPTMILTATAFLPGAKLDSGTTFYPAGTVLGHQARWAVYCSKCSVGEGGNLNLVWQYAPNAWAVIGYSGGTSIATRAMVLKVAANLKIDQNIAYSMPFHIAKLPTGLHLNQVFVALPQAQNPHAGYAQLLLCATSPCADILTGGGLLVSQQSMTWKSTFPTGLNVADAPSADQASEPITINGHSAFLSLDAKGAAVSFTYDGTFVTVSAADTEYQAIGGQSGLIAFASSLTWYGADPAHWTTDVIG